MNFVPLFGDLQPATQQHEGGTKFPPVPMAKVHFPGSGSMRLEVEGLGAHMESCNTVFLAMAKSSTIKICVQGSLPHCRQAGRRAE